MPSTTLLNFSSLSASYLLPLLLVQLALIYTPPPALEMSCTKDLSLVWSMLCSLPLLSERRKILFAFLLWRNSVQARIPSTAGPSLFLVYILVKKVTDLPDFPSVHEANMEIPKCCDASEAGMLKHEMFPKYRKKKCLAPSPLRHAESSQRKMTSRHCQTCCCSRRITRLEGQPVDLMS